MDAGPSTPSTPAPSAFQEDLLVPRRPIVDDARFDITAMVDLVFMMNIYFLVSWIVAAMLDTDVPAARHVVAADLETSVVVTVTGGTGETANVYLGDAQAGKELDYARLDQLIAAAAEEGVRVGKPTVLIKAEKPVVLKHTARIARAASTVKGVQINLGVVEKD